MRICAFLIAFLALGHTYGQKTLLESLRNFLLPEVDVLHYPEVKIDWSFPGNVQVHLNSGLTELIDGKNPEKALRDFTNAIRLKGDIAVLYYYRAVCYKMVGQFKNAEDDLLTAVRLDKEQPAYFLELGELYQLAGDFKQADQKYKKAIHLNPSFALAYYQLGNSQAEQQNLLGATFYYKTATQVDSTFALGYAKWADLSYRHQKNKHLALGLLQKAIDRDSTCMPAFFQRGLIMHNESSYSEALKCWSKLISYQPEFLPYYLLRSVAYMEVGDFDMCYIDVKKVLDRYREDENGFRITQSYLNKYLDLQFALQYFMVNGYGLSRDVLIAVKQGLCLLAVGNVNKAAGVLEWAAKQEPTAVTYFFAAVAFDHFGSHDSAFKYYDLALKEDNDIFDAHKKRGIYRSEHNDWKGANADFAEMERIEPGLKITCRLRGQIRIHYNDFNGGIIDLTKYIGLDTTDNEVYFMRGSCFQGVGDHKNAIRDFEKSFHLGNKEHAVKQIVISNLALGDTVKALAELTKYESLLHYKYFLVDLRLRVMIAQKKYSEARSMLKKAFYTTGNTLSPSDLSELLFLRALINHKIGKYKVAAEEFNAAVRYNHLNLEAMYWRGKNWILLNRKYEAIADFRAVAASNYGDSKAILAVLEASE